MRRILALFLVISLPTQWAFAAANGYEVRVTGDSAKSLPVGAEGKIDTRDLEHLNLSYKAGRNWDNGKFPKGSLDVPYARVSSFVYGETKNLRVGQTIALTAVAGAGGLLLLLSKSKTHYLSIYFTDLGGHDQVMSFEVGKDDIRPLIESLEVRTGKKLQLEDGPVDHADQRPK